MFNTGVLVKRKLDNLHYNLSTLHYERRNGLYIKHRPSISELLLRDYRNIAIWPHYYFLAGIINVSFGARRIFTLV